MDFSILVNNLESILGYSFGGVTVTVIIAAAVKVGKWLKTNSVERSVDKVVDRILGKGFKIDLTLVAKSELAKIKTELLDMVKSELEKETIALQNQSKILTHLADIQLQRKTLLSEEQIKALQADTEAIRTHAPVKVKESINIVLEPIEVTKPKKESKKIYLE